MVPYKKVAFHTLGCKLNFSETSAIARLFENQGFSRVDFSDAPDIFVINTCSVTNNADKECRMIVRRALKQNPEAFIAVIGCYAQLKPEEIASIEGVDLVLGANEKFNLSEHISSLEKKKTAEVFAAEIKTVKQFVPSFSSRDRTRSFLKVQDGCDYFCSFCTIPLARGTSRSNTVAETIASAQQAALSGVKEIVLTGVNIGDFGKTEWKLKKGETEKVGKRERETGRNDETGKGRETFFDLVCALDVFPLENGEEEIRFRISSIEPNLLSDEIIEFVSSSKRFTSHFHIPLQSGSDKILTLMRRRYDKKLYADRITAIKSRMPHCCIGADVIVGFPGETEEDFLETYTFLNELEVSYLHVFTYSERDNTTAVRIDQPVPLQERNRRNKMLQILSEKKKRKFYEDNTGRKCTVLFEQENDNGWMYGFTENYIKVKTGYDPLLTNTFQKMTLKKIGSDGIIESEMMGRGANVI